MYKAAERGWDSERTKLKLLFYVSKWKISAKYYSREPRNKGSIDREFGISQLYSIVLAST